VQSSRPACREWSVQWLSRVWVIPLSRLTPRFPRTSSPRIPSSGNSHFCATAHGVIIWCWLFPPGLFAVLKIVSDVWGLYCRWLAIWGIFQQLWSMTWNYRWCYFLLTINYPSRLLGLMLLANLLYLLVYLLASDLFCPILGLNIEIYWQILQCILWIGSHVTMCLWPTSMFWVDPGRRWAVIFFHLTWWNLRPY